MPDKLKPEEAKRLIEELERIMQVGYGELHIKVQNARVISWKSEAQWELRKEANNGEKTARNH